jgi:hypothetical protein
MFEHRRERLLPRSEFLARVLRHALVAFGLIAGSLLIGVLGYRLTEGLSWVDAVLEASMILTGMGPVHELHSTAGKLFASAYALFSGVVFLTIVAVAFAPIFHRFLHRFHLGADDTADEREVDEHPHVK